MQTHVVENHAERLYDFPVADKGPEGPLGRKLIIDPKKRITFPRAGLRRDEKGDRVMTPGRLEITDEQLQLLKGHPVAKHWFKPGQLSVVETKGEPDKRQAAK